MNPGTLLTILIPKHCFVLVLKFAMPFSKTEHFTFRILPHSPWFPFVRVRVSCLLLLKHWACFPNGQLGTLYREVQGQIVTEERKLGCVVGFSISSVQTGACLLLSPTSESVLGCSLCNGNWNPEEQMIHLPPSRSRLPITCTSCRNSQQSGCELLQRVKMFAVPANGKGMGISHLPLHFTPVTHPSSLLRSTPMGINNSKASLV